MIEKLLFELVVQLVAAYGPEIMDLIGKLIVAWLTSLLPEQERLEKVAGVYNKWVFSLDPSQQPKAIKMFIDAGTKAKAAA